MHASHRYAWLAGWGSDLLSPWAYFQRFQFANVIKHRDLLEQLRVEWLPPSILASDKSDFVTFSALDDAKVRSLFGISLQEQTKLFLKRFFAKGKNVQLYYPKSMLQTCPICMTHGYHSQLHQIKGVDFCAFHDVPLQNCCPACGRRHWYRFDDAGFRTPFACECGFNFMYEHGEWAVELWTSHHDWPIINPHVRAMESMTHLYRISKDRPVWGPSRLDNQTMTMVARVYKAFMRHKRRQLNRLREKRALVHMHHDSANFSAYVYAYIKMKMFAEHLDSHTQVDAGQRDIIENLHQGLLSNTSDLMHLHRATLLHFPYQDRMDPAKRVVQQILLGGLVLILHKRYEHYFQEGNTLVSKSNDERMRAIKRREYKRTCRRKPRDRNGTLIQHSRLESP